MDNKLFYPANTKCPVCGNFFKSLRTRASLLALRSMDADFCEHYQDGYNPLEHYVIVCPRCFFAAEKAFFERPPTINKEITLRTTNKARDMIRDVDLSGSRDESQVLLSFRLALLWAETGKQNFYYRGLLRHRLAWYYRKQGQPEQEHAELEQAAALYAQAYSNDPGLPKSMGLGGFEYILGELYRRIDKFEEAARWLSRAREVSGTSMRPKIKRMWEDAWDKVRESLPGSAAAPAPEKTGGSPGLLSKLFKK